MNCDNLSLLANRTEKGMVQHKGKYRRANTGGLSVYWQDEDSKSVLEDNSSKDALAEQELQNLIESRGRQSPLQMKEKDLVGMTRAGKT